MRVIFTRNTVHFRGSVHSLDFSWKVGPLMTVFILAGIGVLGALLAAVALWHRRAQPADLGSVSHTWIAELRAGDPYDSSR